MQSSNLAKTELMLPYNPFIKGHITDEAKNFSFASSGPV